MNVNAFDNEMLTLWSSNAASDSNEQDKEFHDEGFVTCLVYLQVHKNVEWNIKIKKREQKFPYVSKLILSCVLTGISTF